MGKTSAPAITKSRYLVGRQCLKYLWILVHEPTRIPVPDPAARHRLAEGYLIDRLAKTTFPEGIDIPSDNFLKNIEETHNRLAQRRPLFEAGFQAGDLSARADILRPRGKTSWDIIEVKSSTEVKDVHVDDVAFQRHCYEAAGVVVSGCYLMHVDGGYVRQGDIDPDRLLITENITALAGETLAGMEESLRPIRRSLAAATCPAIDIGAHCTSPAECPLRDECWGILPDDNVFTLYFGGKKSRELYEHHIVALTDIPAGTPLSDRQAVQVACATSGRAHVDQGKIGEFLASLRYPLSFLDFETFATAVPQFDQASPYRPVPFQFSLHVLSAPGAPAVHRSFLAEGPADPRPEFLKALKAALPRAGSVIVYNQTFERSILAALAAMIPEWAEWINAVMGRLADLLIPFRAFHYYHPLQRGSASLKAVLPALTGKTYDHLAISDGLAASRQYISMMYGELFGRRVSDKERRQIRRDLLEYCGLDTEGMIWILQELQKVTETSQARPG